MLVDVLHKMRNKHFHVVVVQKQQRNVQKSVMHVQSCCFAYETNFIPFIILTFLLRSRRWILKSLLYTNLQTPHKRFRVSASHAEKIVK